MQRRTARPTGRQLWPPWGLRNDRPWNQLVNILTHPVHTPYQFDLAKTGHQFYSIPIPWSGEVFWDYHSRPKPPNFHCLKSLWGSRIKFDLVLAHDSLGFDLLKSVDVPVIFKEHCIRAAFHVPKHWLERVSLYSFASETAASRWVMPPGHRHQKRIIAWESIVNRSTDIQAPSRRCW